MMLSWVFGTFTSHLWIGFTRGASGWIATDAHVLCPRWRGLGLYPSIHLQTPLVSLPWQLISCFNIVLATGSLGPIMVLDGHLLMASAWWQSSLLALRPTSGQRDPSDGLGTWASGAFGHPSMPIPAKLFRLYGRGGLGRFFFCTSWSVRTGQISSYRHGGLGRMFISVSLPLFATHSTLFGSSGPGILISRCCLPVKNNGFQGPNLSLFGISLFWRKWWSERTMPKLQGHLCLSNGTSLTFAEIRHMVL